jgi:hypothetical protein
MYVTGFPSISRKVLKSLGIRVVWYLFFSYREK